MKSILFFLMMFSLPKLILCQHEILIEKHLASAKQQKEDRNYLSALSEASKADSLMALQSEAQPERLADIRYLKGILSYNLSDYARAITDLQTAASIYLEKRAYGHLADCYLWLGNTVWYTEGTQAAINYFDQAINVVEKYPNAERTYRGRYYVDKGYAYLYTSEFVQAKQLIERGIQMDTSFSGLYHPHVAESLQVLAQYYEFSEDYYGAIAVYQQVEQIFDRLYTKKDQLDYGPLYGNIGNFYFKVQQFTKAIDYLHKALNIFQKYLPPNHPNILMVYTALSDIYINLQEPDKSYQFIQKAEAANVPQNPSITVIINMGKAFYHQSQGEWEQAGKLFSGTLSQVETNYGISKDLAWIYELIGANHVDSGNAQHAYTFYRKAVAVYEQVLSKSHYTLARVYGRMASAFVKEEKYDSAHYYADLGLDLIWTKHQDFSKIPDLDSWSILVDAKTLALTAMTPTEDVEGLKEAINWYLLSDQYFQFLRNNYNEKEDKTVLADLIDKLHKNLVNLAFRLQEQAPEYLHTAFQVAERNKANLLIEAVRNAAIPYLEHFLETAKDVNQELNYYREKIYEAELTGDMQRPLLNEWRAKVFDLKQELERIRSEARLAQPKLFQSVEGDHYLTVRDVQEQLLEEDEALLEYFVGKNNIYVFLVKKDGFSTVEVKRDPALEGWAREFRSSVTQPLPYTLNNYCEYAQKLYNILIAPVADQLPEKLIIVPHDFLSFIPFEALLTEAPEKLNAPSLYPYLLQKHQIRYTYSGTLLKEMVQKHHIYLPNQQVLAMAPFATVSNSPTSAPSPNRAERYDFLPGTKVELDSLQKYLETKAYYGPDALKALFLAQASTYKILHLATHAEANPQFGEQSHLIFSPESGSTTYQKFYVRDLYNLLLNADMVVLSACGTGYGELAGGEGVISLARAFAYAGAKSIVTSLWKINDASTQQIIINFYRHLKNGYTKDQALRQAKLDYLNRLPSTSSKGHPALWSAMIIIGDTDRIK